jgi:5-formyltetrahydrofolate cyclo-ligase
VTSPHESKPALRRVLRTTRPDLQSQLGQSSEIRDALRNWLSHHPARVIACFASIPGEPMLLPLLLDLPDRKWVLPRVDGETMTFHFVAPSVTALQSGAFGIAEPPADSPVCPIEDIELFLCPGMAFTSSGKRLGRGKGFYDRTLAVSDSESVRVGVCFREQIHPELPTDPHDLPMHFLATPDGIAECVRPTPAPLA